MHNEEFQKKIDRSFFEPQLESEAKKELYDLLDSGAENYESDHDLNHVYRRVQVRIEQEVLKNKRIARTKLFRAITSRAAIFVLGLLSSMLIWYNYPNSAEQETPITIIAPTNAITQAILPDGSKIMLNANSKISYHKDNRDHQRIVSLEGEAWFDVIKDAKTPFIVSTNSYKVLVHGTAFNVRSFPDNSPVVTTLEHGSIEILPLVENNKSPKAVILKPGQQYYFDPKNNESHLSKVDSRFASLWKESEIKFENKNFKDLLKILEGRYHVHFIVKDPELFDYHYDGTIRNETLASVLDILRLTLPFQYRMGENNTVEIKK
ncbi:MULTISPECIES: FecR family protein [Sphingobacterium]|uniref:FecR family protein n=1 Tax=Sphingobacterium TaxID=28453 RepID=UPI0013DD71C0|nr:MULTISPECIES: FecR domain-containing protein [unclassified Sphingobacterium]